MARYPRTAVARAAINPPGGDLHGVELAPAAHWWSDRGDRGACPPCDRVLQAHEPVCRTVETMVGSVQLTRPYFYCRACRCGMYPLDEVLGLSVGRLQLDVPQDAADLVTEDPYDTASTLFGHLSGITVSSERMHTLTNQAAEGLTVLDVAPSRDEMAQWVAELAAGRLRRPVLVLGI